MITAEIHACIYADTNLPKQVSVLNRYLFFPDTRLFSAVDFTFNGQIYIINLPLLKRFLPCISIVKRSPMKRW